MCGRKFVRSRSARCCGRSLGVCPKSSLEPLLVVGDLLVRTRRGSRGSSASGGSSRRRTRPPPVAASSLNMSTTSGAHSSNCSSAVDGDRVRDPEAAVVPADQVEDLPGRRAIALLRDLQADPLVRLVVEVERIAVEDRVAPEPEGLVHLEVEADRGHEGSEDSRRDARRWRRRRSATPPMIDRLRSITGGSIRADPRSSPRRFAGIATPSRPRR